MLKNKRLFAIFLVFLGAIFFSAKAVLVKLAYAYAVDSVSLLALRMLFALPVFLLVVFWSQQMKTGLTPISRKDWLRLLFLGVIGYYLASLFDFLGLQHVSAGMERLILFMYPTIVLLLSALFFHKPILPKQYFALLLTYLGISMAFFEQASRDESGNFMLGGGLVLLSALTYALYLIGVGEMVRRVGTLRFTSLAMSIACLAVLIHSAIIYGLPLFNLPAPVYKLAFLMAMISTVIPAFMVTEGIKHIGAGDAAIVGSIGPVSTIILAYIFLDEVLGPWQWIGTVFVIAGVIRISKK